MVAPADGDGDGAAAAAAQGRGPGQAAATTTYPVKRFVYVIANITALSGLLFGWVGACVRAFLESGSVGGVECRLLPNTYRTEAIGPPFSYSFVYTYTHPHTPRGH